MKSTVAGCVALTLLCVPGLLLLETALAADFGPLDGTSSRLGPARWLLLLLSALALGYALAVHAKATRELKKTGRPYATTVLFLVAPTAALLGLLLVVAEVGAGWVEPAGHAGLVFPPNSTATFQTSEYTWTVRTNSLGIRDREIDPSQRPQLRIVAIGDSFTNGWGVEAAEAWPKVLQRRLREAAIDVEVLNLGGAGASPTDYAIVARRAAAELQPDLFLLGVLQGDDLAQLRLGEGRLKRSLLQGAMERWLPNLCRHLAYLNSGHPREISSRQIRETWQRQIHTLLDNGLDRHALARWERLDVEVQQMYLAGELNPTLLRFALSQPELLTWTCRLDDPQTLQAIDALAAQLAAVKRVAAKRGARVIALSIPCGAYVSRRAHQNLQRLGYQLEETMLHSEAPDEAIRRACRQARVPFHCVTEQFRQASRTQALYYEFDSHFNTAGQALFAEAVAAWLLREGLLPMASAPL